MSRWGILRYFGMVAALLWAQQPPNDNCQNASFIRFGSPHNPYATGIFYSDTVFINAATLQAGEFIPAGNPNGKTVWYRFFLPTTRTVRIILRQVGTTIDPTHAGWTLYREETCLPGASRVVDPPIRLMEGYTHACLRRGWYLVQVGTNLAATGQIFLELQVSTPQISAGAEALYDLPIGAQNLSTLNTSSASPLLRDFTFDFGCQSVDEGEAICNNDSSWSKSSWHVFRTDGYIDWLGLDISEDPWNNAVSGNREWRVFLYKGDIRNGSESSLQLISGCVPMVQSSPTVSAHHQWYCQLEPNTFYSLKILGRTTYANRIRVRLYERGSSPSVSVSPTSIPASHNLGTLSFGPTYTISEHWGCNARIQYNRCGNGSTALTPSDTIAGEFDLALYYRFSLPGPAHVRFWYSNPWGNFYCAGTVRFRIFREEANSDGCNLTLQATVDNDAWLYCFPAGNYLVQVLGRSRTDYARWTCAGSHSQQGLPINLHVQLGSPPLQRFGLHAANEADSINNGNFLVPGVTYYSQYDVFDCRTTVLPAGDVCGGRDRAIYRIIKVNQAGVIEVGGGQWWHGFRYNLYLGDARTAPIVNGRLQGLTPIMACNDLYYAQEFCVGPGTYTLVSLGHPWHLGVGDQPWVRFHVWSEKFGLRVRPAQADLINNGNPLQPNTNYQARRDSFDCQTTPLPAGVACGGYDRAIYRIIYVDQPGILEVWGGEQACRPWGCQPIIYRLYAGDARTLPLDGNGNITGLTPLSPCLTLGHSASERMRVCVTPGYYTLVSFGHGHHIRRGDAPWVRLHVFDENERRFHDPTAAVNQPGDSDPRPGPQYVGALQGSNHSLTSGWTRITCHDNPLAIGGQAPCGNATKQYYWELYIAEPSLVWFQPSQQDALESGIAGWRWFSGRISQDGAGNLTPVGGCQNGFERWCLSPGWYTVVAYVHGDDYTNIGYGGGRGGGIGSRIWFQVWRDPRTQKFGTFATADQLGVTDYGPNQNTAQVPLLRRIYTPDWEFWSCANNLPFPAGITPCNPSDNRISYRVFELTKPSYVVIRQGWPYTGHYWYSSSRLYQGDITTSSPPYTIVHDCFTGIGRICWLPPGKYTLVTFANDGHIGGTYQPIIYVDSTGYAKHDWARNAYDFGFIPADNVEYRTRPGDPLGPFGRPGSTDFIFCTSGASGSDPIDPLCPVGGVDGTVASSNPPALVPQRRRNLWYTFTAQGNARIHVNVAMRTPVTENPPPFAVYESDEDPNAFPAAIDSTFAQGLVLRAHSQPSWPCCQQSSTVSFSRDACTPRRRYYVVVYLNTCSPTEEPMRQVDVGIRVEPLPGGGVSYDHFVEANPIVGNPTITCNPPYTPVVLDEGTYTGCEGDLTCATRAATDQNSCGTRTIWYTFETNVLGYVNINYDRIGVANGAHIFNGDDIQLYRQLVPGDSTAAGLVRVPLSGVTETHPTLGNRGWGRACITPGRYYIMFTGCNHTGVVRPRVWLRRHRGDFCTDSVKLVINGLNVSDTARLFINCFTIGEAPGEQDTIMGCFGTPVGRKSAWVLVENTSPDTMDFDVQIIEETDAMGNQVLYRVLTGDCSRMNQEECVAEGTYVTLHLKCRPPFQGFWVQVVMPEWATGNIKVGVTSSPSQKPCVPPDPEKPRANFDYRGQCVRDVIQFLNYSSLGPNLSYHWTFGDGASSTHFEPQHQYLAPDTYLVCLGVSNGLQTDTACRYVIIYPTPKVSLTPTPSSPVPAGTPITFNPVYTDTARDVLIFWDFCRQPNGLCGATLTSYEGTTPPPVRYLTPGRKRVCVSLMNGPSCDTTICTEFDVYLNADYPGGRNGGAVDLVAVNHCFVEQPVVPSSPGGINGGAADIVVVSNCPTPIPPVTSVPGGINGGAADIVAVSLCPTPIPPVTSVPGGRNGGAADMVVVSFCPTPIPPVTSVPGGRNSGAADIVLWGCPPPPPPPPPVSAYRNSGAADIVLVNHCFVEHPVVPSAPGGLNGGSADAVAISFCPTPLPEVPSVPGGRNSGAADMVVVISCPTVFPPVTSMPGGRNSGAADIVIAVACPTTPPPSASMPGGRNGGAADIVLNSVCIIEPPVVTSIPGGRGSGATDIALANFCEMRIAGGVGSGAMRAYLASFSVRDTSVCAGMPAALVASAPSDWYLSATGGSPVATGTATLTLNPLNESQLYYVQNSCTPQRMPAFAAAIPKLQGNVSATPGPYCTGVPVVFTNQTQVAGPSQPSFGTLITAFGAHGSAPTSMSRLTFSSVQTANFTLLGNNVHDGGNAWTAGNSGAGTQWAQWYYPIPRSVNRIVFWACQGCPNAAQRLPLRARLYYATSTGWKIAKVFTFTPGQYSFDSGIFAETQNIFAHRWRLEFDVAAANAPAFGEFQVYSSSPVVGGTTARWSCDGGATWTSAATRQCTWTTAGTHTVRMIVENYGACPDTVVVPVEVQQCGPLPAIQSVLAAYPTREAQVELLWRTNFPIQYAVLEKWVDTGWVSLYRHEEVGATSFGWVDSFPSLSGVNMYRVVSEHGSGELVYSNVAEVRFDKEGGMAIEEFVRAYPNPVTELLILQMGLSVERTVEVRIYDVKGAMVGYYGPVRLRAGLHEMVFSAHQWASGLYSVQVYRDGEEKTIKILKILP